MTHQPVALVTGGAQRIGRAIVETLAAHGYAVAIHCHESRAQAQTLRDQLTHAGQRAAIVQGDLADADIGERLIAEAQTMLGPITLLVNNASMFEPDALGTLAHAAWKKQFTVNLEAPVFLAQAMARALPDDLQGCIINLIDQRVWKLTPQFVSYTLTKSALFTATKTLAQALAPRIRVNGVGPGPTFANVHDGDGPFQKEVAATLLRHPSHAQDIAEAVLYLARAHSVTGQMIAVDSGQHLIWQTPDIA